MQQNRGAVPSMSQHVTPGARGRPPRPPAASSAEDVSQPVQQKPKVPVLEKHLVDQLSSVEQNSLNSKFQEAVDADKKVSDPVLVRDHSSVIVDGSCSASASVFV